jgi:hypothetical protein
MMIFKFWFVLIEPLARHYLPPNDPDFSLNEKSSVGKYVDSVFSLS